MMWWWIIGFGFLFFVIFFYINRNRYRTGEKKPESPMNILKKRFAKGEITKEEYENQRKTLDKND